MLVDASTGDDAAVYRLADGRALVVTLDFFTPIVDDPYDFGRIAAANALSDVYAMGGRPLFALNLLSFPRGLLDEGLAEEIIRGGAEKAAEAGIPVLGGHSIDDAEPKYGMVAVGEVDPDGMLANDGARVGDDLVLTKPLGTGIVATAVKAGKCPPGLLSDAVEWMARLNRGAAEAARAVGAHAATDVTGYGLTGHLGIMARASGVSARIEAARVPLLEGVEELVEAGFVPGGTRRNRADGAGSVTVEGEVSEAVQVLLADAQTSGGLLISCPPERTEELLRELELGGESGVVVGKVGGGMTGHVVIAGKRGVENLLVAPEARTDELAAPRKGHRHREPPPLG